jgi:hypothetical protein
MSTIGIDASFLVIRCRSKIAHNTNINETQLFIQTNMNYQDYINLGFERTEMNCSVEFKQTGYGGFALTKKVNENIMVEVAYPTLNEPNLYIRKGETDSWHIFPIPIAAIKDLFRKQD